MQKIIIIVVTIITIAVTVVSAQTLVGEGVAAVEAAESLDSPDTNIVNRELFCVRAAAMYGYENRASGYGSDMTYHLAAVKVAYTVPLGKASHLQISFMDVAAQHTLDTKFMPLHRAEIGFDLAAKFQGRSGWSITPAGGASYVYINDTYRDEDFQDYWGDGQPPEGSNPTVPNYGPAAEVRCSLKVGYYDYLTITPAFRFVGHWDQLLVHRYSPSLALKGKVASSQTGDFQLFLTGKVSYNMFDDKGHGSNLSLIGGPEIRLFKHLAVGATAGHSNYGDLGSGNPVKVYVSVF